MITVDEAINIANTAQIPFPLDWRDQLSRSVTISGKVAGGPHYTTFYVTPEQFGEVSSIIKQNGFRVDEHFQIRYDGVPLEIDVYW